MKLLTTSTLAFASGLGWAVGLAACGPAGDGSGGSGGTVGTFGSDTGGDSSESTSEGELPPTESTGESASASADESADAESDSGPDAKFDLPVPDAPPETGCQKVDLLFVVDNSFSMWQEQAALIASFPGFVAGMQAALVGVDSYHVGVVTSDAYAFNAEGCRELGALVTQTGGTASSQAVCGPYAAGGAYMSELDDLGVAFACAAQVGTEGDTVERQVGAVLGALEGDGPNACNTGFLRDDSLLVITFLSDEPDNATPGTPVEWFDQIVAARQGIETNIVLASIVSTNPPNCPVFVSTDLLELTDLFTHGFVGDICEPSYDATFQAAIGVIDSACEEYVPPG